MNAPKKNLLPAPVIFPGDEPFWQASREGRLLIKHCPSCGGQHFYPRQHCPICGHPETEWREVSGRGTIYSFTRMARAARPTAPAVIELEGGLRLASVVVDADVHALQIGDPVSLRFLPTEGDQRAPAFTTPAADAARQYSRQAMQALALETARSQAVFKRAAVIGSGHMGCGITLACLAAGLQVQLIDRSPEALQAGQARILAALQQDLERGRLDASAHADRVARLQTRTELQDVAQAEVIIEAIFEDLAIKQALFAELDTLAAPGALLATNTSTLDVGAIASVTRRPDSVVGLHFFNPANVMRLIEVIRAPQTSPACLQQARALATQLGKTPVVVGICDGFVGNRLMIRREREAARLLLEGALPQQIDRVLREFGLPMGTFELQDMAGGIALTHRARQRAGQRDWLIEQLFERGRTGLRDGKGYYRYEPGKRTPLVDPEVTALIEQASVEAGLQRRAIADREILARLILPMINEAAKLIEEGMVERPSDIDLVWQLGYGWPDWKGGPVYHADHLGIAQVLQELQNLQAAHGERFEPAALLRRLATSGQRLQDALN